MKISSLDSNIYQQDLIIYMAVCTDEGYQFPQDKDCELTLFVRLKLHVHQQAVKLISQLEKHGVHSSNQMRAAGFQYTGIGDTAQCGVCGLQVSEWTQEMNPFCVHLERNPDCQFVRSIRSKYKYAENHEENPSKRQKTESNSKLYDQQNGLIELDILKEIRRRTFSHWPHQSRPSREQMIAAGFFQCNVGDRSICLYCNLICQQWKGDTDDPAEIHKTLSPKCAYVLSMLSQDERSSVLIANENSSSNDNNAAVLLNNTNRLRCDQIVFPSPCHADYASIASRYASFATWTNQASPSVDDLVRAGFFYKGEKNIVTCFYCNGSLHKWGENDNPLIEHIRWFSHCGYAKQVGGNELYNKIQEAKRIRQDHDNSTVSINTTNNHRLEITDDKQLSRLVAARLDLPMSQRLLDQNFKLSIIKRCWEDQLQLKHDDFASDCDLFIACVILQKQIECIDGKKENIIVPSIKMKLIREREQSGQEQLLSPILPTATANDPIVEAKNVLAESSSMVTANGQTKTEKIIQEIEVPLNNPCAVCSKEEKRLACIPCGHLAVCSGCGQSLRVCPICRRDIEAFVRIYI